MTDLHNAPKTLFEIIDEVLLQFEDENLKSDGARKRIADEVCDRYYTNITPDILNMDSDLPNWASHIQNDDFMQQENNMKNDINVIVSLGPSVFDSGQLKTYKYATIGIKWNPEDDIDFIDDMVLKVKGEFNKAVKSIPEDGDLDSRDKFSDLKNEFGLINLTDLFFEYLKNNERKIEAIRVSMDDYEIDHRDQKLKTLKTQMMVFTADDQSMDDMFSSLVKELYYEYGETVIDIYSIILTPKQYKIVNNIPIEYRGLLVRVKK